MKWIEAPGAADLESGDVIKVDVGDAAVALFRLDDGFYATQDMCTHAVASLSDGYVEDDMIECPVHAGKFCIRSGAVRSMPATVPLKTYPVKEVDGVISIGFDG